MRKALRVHPHKESHLEDVGYGGHDNHERKGGTWTTNTRECIPQELNRKAATEGKKKTKQRVDDERLRQVEFGVTRGKPPRAAPLSSAVEPLHVEAAISMWVSIRLCAILGKEAFLGRITQGTAGNYLKLYELDFSLHDALRVEAESKIESSRRITSLKTLPIEGPGEFMLWKSYALVDIENVDPKLRER
ncbi:hypothetical protein BKA70DRAFT_1235872 [Coprinopsis sp. MPI-PUGE-AT-0042]|nr:hypothetical protein BKA70DRAFT_1235872 [Coprinopsis sp. MPI-PUGE-AT-0042]